MNGILKSMMTVMLVGTLSITPAWAFRAQSEGNMNGATQDCTNRLLTGRYGFTILGTQFEPQPATQAGFVGIGQFDGKGSWSGSDIGSFAGQIVPRTFSGTFTVNPNCTATITLTILTGFPLGATFHLSAVLLNRGAELRFIQTDPGSLFTGTAGRQ